MNWLKPKNFDSALEVIRNWDKNARSLPLLSEQVFNMKDGIQAWSTTHSWPSVRNALVSVGIVEDVGTDNFNGFRVPLTEITDLGKEVRSHLQSQSKGELK